LGADARLVLEYWKTALFVLLKFIQPLHLNKNLLGNVHKKYPIFFGMFTDLQNAQPAVNCEASITREIIMPAITLSIILISVLLVLILIVESQIPLWAVRTVRLKRRR
jgi:hypothetical protein